MDYKLNIDINNANNFGLYVFLIYFKNGKYYIRACRDKNNTNPSITLLFVKIDDQGYVIYTKLTYL